MRDKEGLLKFDDTGVLRVRLIAQSPLMHFEATEELVVDYSEMKQTVLKPQKRIVSYKQPAPVGITLRGTVVRSLLDRYIFCRIAGEPIEGLLSNKTKSRIKRALQEDLRYTDIYYYSGGADISLRYQLSIRVAQDEPSRILRSEEYRPPFFGAPRMTRSRIGQNGHMIQQSYMGVVNHPILTIRCDVPHVQQLIEDYLDEFFLVTNFGMRGRMGFGSYIVQGCNQSPQYIARLLRSVYGAAACYRMEVAEASCNNSGGDTNVMPDYQQHFRQIRFFSRIMKSGVNRREGYIYGFLFQYMYEHGMGNDKEWLRNVHVVPSDDSNIVNDQEYYYGRALLGLPRFMRYLSGENERAQAVQVHIYDTEFDSSHRMEYEKFPSPIFYKIIGDSIYIVAGRIPESMYNHTFRMDATYYPEDKKRYNPKRYAVGDSNRANYGYGEGEIRTPASFDIDDFMAQYVDYYNRHRTVLMDENLPGVYRVD